MDFVCYVASGELPEVPSESFQPEVTDTERNLVADDERMKDFQFIFCVFLQPHCKSCVTLQFGLYCVFPEMLLTSELHGDFLWLAFFMNIAKELHFEGSHRHIFIVSIYCHIYYSSNQLPILLLFSQYVFAGFYLIVFVSSDCLLYVSANVCDRCGKKAVTSCCANSRRAFTR